MQGNGPSASQSYALSGNGFTPASGSLTVTGSTNYEVSLSSATGFGGSVTVPYTGGALAATPIYVRLKAGLTANAYNGETISNAGGGATAQTVAVSGSVTAPPTPGINAGTGTLTFTTTQNTPSAQQSITVTGTSLSTDIAVTAPAGYQLSTTSGNFAGATNTAQLPAAGGTLFVRLSGATVGTFNGDITFTSGSASATRAVQGTVTAVSAGPLLAYDFEASTTPEAPSIQAANVTGSDFSNGAGVNNITVSSNYRAQSWTTNASIDNTDYFQFVFTPATGYTAALQSIVLDERRSGTGIRQWEIRSSLDNYSTIVGTVFNVPDDTNIRTGQVVTLGSAFSNVQTAVTFRIYAYSSEASGGTWFVDNVQLFGTVSPASTDPSISSISPTSGPVGTLVTITGSNFTRSTVSGVFFGSTEASGFTIVSPTQITATVATLTPAGAQPVSLTLNGNTVATGGAFTVVAAPFITVSPGNLSGFSTAQGTPSAPQSYSVSGTGLGNAPLDISTPAGFEVSLTAGGSYSNILAVPTNSSGNVPPTTIFVRLTGVNQGTFTGNIDNNSASATAANSAQVAVSGTVSAGPGLLATPASLSGFTAQVGQNSAAQSYRLTGTGLLADVAVSAPVGYEVSTTAGGTYQPTLSLPISGTGAIDQTIFVRLVNTVAAGTYDNRNVTNTSGGFSVAVGVSGTVTASPTLAAEPTTVGTIAFGPITSSSIQVNVTAGNGSARLLVVRQAAAVNDDPIDGLTYTASSVFGAGTEIGSQNYVVLSSTNPSPSVTVTGLTAGATYFFRLYEYNGTGNNTNYLTTLTANNSATTTAAVATTGPGELYLEEGFAYTLGSDLSASGTWVDNSGGGSQTPKIKVSEFSLSSLQYGTPASVGNAVKLTGNGEDLRRPFAPAYTTGDLYTSFLVNVTNIGSNNLYFYSLLTAADGTNYRARVAVRSGSSAGQFKLGLQYSGSGVPTYMTGDLALGSTYLVVLHSSRIGGTNTVRMYVLDQNAPVAEPAVADAQVTGTDASVLDALVLRQSDTDQNLTLDAIRVGNGWGAVVGRPRYVDQQFVVRSGNYYDLGVNLASATAAVSVQGQAVVQNELLLTQGRLLTTSTNRLTLLASANVTPAAATINSSSFVDGPLAWEYLDGANRVFPIGKDGIVRPFTLSVNQTGRAVYQMEVINEAAPDYGLPANITRRSQVRYFTLNRLSGTAIVTGGQVTLTYGTDDGVNDPAFLRVLRSVNGAPYADQGNNAGGTGNPTGSITSDAFTADFNAQNVFTLGNQTPGVNPLPVELIRFTAQRQADIVRLDWATASEKNNARFEVQRSADGLQFRTLSTVAGQGTTAQRHSYAALDRQPLPGTSYYRLRQVDTNGEASFSPVVAVAAGKELALYPNPARTELQVVAPAAQATYRILSTIGTVVLEGKMATGTATLNVASLPAGLYHLEVTTAAGRVVRKFTKQD